MPYCSPRSRLRCGICTKQEYRDYHMICEFKWGERTWQGRKDRARDSGVVVNHGYNVVPSAGKLTIQTELAEIFVRRWELCPLQKFEAEKAKSK